MIDVAVLGLGAMGSRMAARLLKAGHRVTVWNRSPGAARALTEQGAQQAESPRAAAAAGDYVIAMVRDNDASREVWLDPEVGALAGMRAGAVAIESSTLTPYWVRELGTHCAQRGVDLLEAPVAGSRPQAEAGQLIYLVGGEDTVVQRATPLLREMGSAVQHVGPLGAGALVKLCTNTLLGVQVTVLAELIGMLRRAGADPARALEAVAATPVWSPAATRLSQSMLAGDFSPQFPIDLIAKDFGYVLQTAGDASTAPTIAAAGQVFEDAKARGLGDLNMTGVAKLVAE